MHARALYFIILYQVISVSRTRMHMHSIEAVHDTNTPVSAYA